MYKVGDMVRLTLEFKMKEVYTAICFEGYKTIIEIIPDSDYYKLSNQFLYRHGSLIKLDIEEIYKDILREMKR
jgi:hypothetical protein